MYSLFWQMVPIRETFAQLTYNQLHPISFRFFFFFLHLQVCVEIRSICIVWGLYWEYIKWAIICNLTNNTKEINNFDSFHASWDTCKPVPDCPLTDWLLHVQLFVFLYASDQAKWDHHKMFINHFTADFTILLKTQFYNSTAGDLNSALFLSVNMFNYMYN